MNSRIGVAAVSFAVVILAGCSGVPQSSLTPSTKPDGATSPTTTYTYVDLGPGPNGKNAYGYGESPSADTGTYLDHTISCGKDCSAPVYYPVAWPGSGTPVVLLPNFYVEGWAYGAGGSLIVGTLITNDGGYFGFPHAALWQGSSHTFTDLNPYGSCGSCQPGSNAYNTDGTFIAGSGGSPEHALLWKLGQLNKPVDLNPGGFAYSEAYAVRGTTQVGYAYSSTTKSFHAILWHGTAASAVDLTPSTLSSAYATGLGSKTEVGCGTPSGMTVSHALLWHGSAAKHDRSPTLLGIHRFVRSRCSGKGASGIRTLHLIEGAARVALDGQREDRGRPSAVLAEHVHKFRGVCHRHGGRHPRLRISTSTATWHAVVWIP